MPALPSDLRRVLENAVVAARDEATGAATAALKRLAVGVKEFPNYLTADERVLRQKLRAAARQLGEPWNADKQAFATLNKLTHEVAYEHWHRMLFARFLAENNLLIHPEHGVSVDLATVADLAGEEAKKTGTKADTWALAGRYAAAMLPQIFRPDDPALAVLLAPEHQQALEKILESLPLQVFTADDALGWVYQFWQSAENERVNEAVKAGVKISGDMLPAVTQLFTEHYMVLFLLHNTIGAWHAGKILATSEGQQIASACATEGEVRASVGLPGYSFEYLRLVKDDESPARWRPAAGTFEGWPKNARELAVLDPCCGSGHFLVASLELLSRLRGVEENLDTKAANLAVLSDNLFGLELDARCTQIAAFNVALAAWKLAAEHFGIPELHIACSGLGPSSSLEHWLKLADRNSAAWQAIPQHARQSITNGLTNLHRLFSDAPELGSLIDPTELGAGGELFSADWETLRPFLASALTNEKDDDAHERAVAAQGMAKAAEILSRSFTLVVTNVPFLGRKSHSTVLRSWADKAEPDCKGDLAYMFVSRMFRWVGDSGTIGFVTPQNWLFLGRYRAFRTRLLTTTTWNVVAKLGSNAFRDMNWWAATTSLTAISGRPPATAHVICGVDTSLFKAQDDKAALLRGEAGRGISTEQPIAVAPASLNAAEADLEGEAPGASGDGRLRLFPQLLQLKNPDARVVLDEGGGGQRLYELAKGLQGVSPADLPRYGRLFWEACAWPERWRCWQTTVAETQPFGGREWCLDWNDRLDSAIEAGIAFVRGEDGWGRKGVVVNQMSTLPVTLYEGDLVDTNAAAVIPTNGADLPAIWCYCSSGEFRQEVRKLDQATKVTNATLVKVPFDLSRWQNVAAERYPNGLPEPQSDDLTQWLFHGHPAGRVPLTPEPNPHTDTTLQIVVARLVGYRWPAELDEKMCLASEARAWVEKCKDLEQFADDDGVVPLVNINKERPGHERIRTVLEAAFSSKWTPALLNDLLTAAGNPGKSLDDWLRGGDFWAQHCSVFHQRPFVWQIWDGKKDGFNVLVHYHRLAEGDGKGHKLLQKITYTYLGDWIAQQQAAAKRGEAGADTRLKAAQDLQKKLEAVLAGEPPYDIFVRWKPLHEQPIGWNADINDGVRQNIRPFIAAGVLRKDLSKILKAKDRGKELESIRPKAQFPWFWSCPEDDPPTDFMGGDKFTGERLNDLHYTRKAKEAARAVMGGTA